MCVEGFHTDRFLTVINIIKIKELASHFARCGLTDRSVAIQILTLLIMWQNFNTKRGTQQQKTVSMETLNTHFLLTVYTTFNSFFFPFYVILYRIRKEHYSSTYLLLYHCAND
jgi:hypothetical protein